jgi:hypothetical protein
MKTIAGGLVLALVLIAAGAVFWSQSQLTRRVADAHLKLATLRYDSDDATDATTSAWDLRRWQMGTLADDVTRYRATVTYWLGRYQALTPLLSVTGALAVKDSSVMFAAANAAYRTSNPEVGDHKVAVERLDADTQRRFRALGVFAPAPFGREAVAAVWDEDATRSVLTQRFGSSCGAVC